MEFPPNFLREMLTINVSTSRQDLRRCFAVLKQFDCQKRIFHRTNSPLKIEDPSIHYISTTSVKHIERHYRLARLVETPYLYELADDDIYLPEFAFTAISFLNSNPNWGTVRGYLPQFNERTEEVHFGLAQTKRQAMVLPKLLKDNYWSDNAQDRVRYHLAPQNMYNPSRNLKRTHIQVKNMSFLVKFPEYIRLCYIDRIYAILECLHCNIKTIPVLQGAKSNGITVRNPLDMPAKLQPFDDIKSHLKNLIEYSIETCGGDYNEWRDLYRSLSAASPKERMEFSQLRELEKVNRPKIKKLINETRVRNPRKIRFETPTPQKSSKARRPPPNSTHDR